MPTDAKTLVASLLDGRARVGDGPDGKNITLGKRGTGSPTDRLRAAYAWIVRRALRTSYFDVEFGPRIELGGGDRKVALVDGEAYASFVLLPILTLMTSRRLLILGAPGRGKTTVATLMALIAGDSLDEVRRSVQHGHPQLTVTDLLGSPLPAELVRAERTDEIRVAWRNWITRRVKIIDEYNRIPTKTQSALLSLMAEGYAEMYEQTVETGRSAWFLTANDDLGGGTFPVIAALKDRLDAVVRSTPFHSEHLEVLDRRIARAQRPEEALPDNIRISADELTEVDRQVREVPIPDAVREIVGFFASQLDFCRQASTDFERMSKDTLHLSGRKLAHVCNEDCPLDKQAHICSQAETGISPRTYQALFHYAKALAFFRGQPKVSLDDVRALAPWILFAKLKPNPQSAFFQKTENATYANDRAGWISQLFERALDQYAAYGQTRDEVRKLATLAQGADALQPAERAKRRDEVRQRMKWLLDRHELSAPVHEDVMFLKGIYARLGS
ncbi:MoxR family ATPase [Persicimonas caeni]|uniref:MoxR family ATPase n=1 Tax=Persicimonas caeni TaxID=2292766 RepID=A0A4Y6PVC9_PERCE|nr:MoxR family ATPase [Persicimonas caeni]QDG52286.1 MoxR family ATPase [Persicimonas caeni]QED33508.1 MoxR family ATPase [Persicimonas caeni]